MSRIWPWNVSYMIIANILINQMHDIIPSIIFESQSTFSPHWSISNNILVAYEPFHTLKIKRKGRAYNVALKLSISKAYDKVEWSSLRAIMGKL